MMLVWVLVLTTLLASDVAGTSNSLGLEETQHHIEKRDVGKKDCKVDWVYYPPLKSCFRFFCDNRTWTNAETGDFGVIDHVLKRQLLFVPIIEPAIRRLQNHPLILSSSGSSALISL
ncbi:uncharacterized protein LOC116985273 isoform X2 [Amblyraja radiata]|uniref:uncharacterized protein LOC116985273 isoform X2 n=1 Tax=Amblyraja radiata TaxID=386614 RepID=UPI0014035C5C|nr:uncharacterized protein LOC116985273 isoform X2 [Amblyraja radiata]